ncbi:hypothetical protein UY3_03839, partial [Chelonia mydas]
NVLLNSRKPSTRYTYILALRKTKFSVWSQQKEVSPSQAPIQIILDFLLHLKEKGFRPQVRAIAAPTGRSSPFQANGGCGKAAVRRSRPMGAAGSDADQGMCWLLLPTAPIGLERRTAASGSCDRTNLRTLQIRFAFPNTGVV